MVNNALVKVGFIQLSCENLVFKTLIIKSRCSGCGVNSAATSYACLLKMLNRCVSFTNDSRLVMNGLFKDVSKVSCSCICSAIPFDLLFGNLKRNDVDHLYFLIHFNVTCLTVRDWSGFFCCSLAVFWDWGKLIEFRFSWDSISVSVLLVVSCPCSLRRPNCAIV